MESVVIIQEELKKQKKAIEEMDGKVIVANLNPTPAEITEGIKSIPSVDLSGSTATEQDVKQGKTFYSGNSILKTGTAVFEGNTTNALFMSPEETVTYDEEITYYIPTDVKKVRKYCYYSNYNTVTIYFHDDIEVIDEYSFYKTKNFKFENFENLQKVWFIGMYSFAYGTVNGIDIGRLPDSVTNLGSYTFYDSLKPNSDIRIPSGITTFGQYAFMTASRMQQNTLDISDFSMTQLTAYTFANQAFNCDFVAPAKLKTINMYFNNNGCFKNIDLGNVVTLSTLCFGASDTKPISDFYLKTVTFNTETPPTCGRNIFALQNLQNCLKIYVPDNSIEAYKAVSNLSPYYDVIFPMSQKP